MENLIANKWAPEHDLNDFFQFDRNKFAAISQLLIFHGKEQNQDDELIHVPEIVNAIGVATDNCLSIDDGADNISDELLQ